MRPCPRLVELTLDYRDDGRTEAELLQLLERQNHLRTIDFGTQMNELLTVLVFAELSALNTLRDMSLARNFIFMDVRNALYAIRPWIHLQHIRKLGIELNSAAVPSLLSVARSLQTLNLVITNTDSDGFSTIGRLTHLRILEICFQRPIEITKAELSALSNLTRLQKLTLESGDNGELQAFSITDDDLAKFSACLPNSNYISFHVQSRLTTSFIASLTTACRLLQHVEIPDAYDLSFPSQHEDILFPNLRVLDVGSVENTTNPPRCVYNVTYGTILPSQD